ncbi:MAG: ESA_00282 family adhesion-associated protein [Kluyvera sp.]|uniref:ESA_00282 family adhesion-associated protein n=1 Tax=Kluyvera sp. TaxID=1538228 RepID=UPI003A8A52FF
MSGIIYFVMVLLLLTVVILFFMYGQNNETAETNNETVPPPAPAPLNKDQGENHFAGLMSRVTPSWYWRINHEYIDFVQSTIKRLSIDQLKATPGLFEAQERCRNLNGAVYEYYDEIKRRCLKGERVADVDPVVLSLQKCYEEFALEAYPELVALVWPDVQRPFVRTHDV